MAEALSSVCLAEQDAQLFDAHERGDLNAMVRVYARIARHHAAHGDTSAEAYFLTQAWVCALDAGAAEGAWLRSRLVALGCEKP